MTTAQHKLPLTEIFPEPPDDIDLALFDPAALPEHLAVIMDGNGRWAEQRHLGRVKGHNAGIQAVRELIRSSNDLGIRYLTIYSFSTENWSRPAAEVQALMRLFARTLAAELEPMAAEDVRIRVLGDLRPLPRATRQTFERAVQRTASNQGMNLVIAVNYGSRLEIVQAAQRLAQAALAGEWDPNAADAATAGMARFAEALNTADLPDPDLLIRTSGEYRLSNFLLYQMAYSELYFTPTLWPDFDRYELLRALIAFQHRRRRFGGVS